MNRIAKQIAIAALALTAVAAPAAAQGITIGPDGIKVQDPRDNERSDRPERNDRRAVNEVTEREAIRTAKSEGVREVEDVRRTKSSYKVEGTDRSGDDITVTVDRRSGNVVSVQ